MKQTIKLVAHRGGKGVGLENTYEAFKNAISLGYDGVECDIQFTQDNEIVVFHDLTLDRLAGVSKKIKDLTWEELKDIKLSKKETDGLTYEGKMLLFKEFLQMIKNKKILAFIELKETFTEANLSTMFKLLDDMEISENEYVIIANLESIDLLVKIGRMRPNCKRQFVARTNYQDYIDICLNENISLDIAYDALEQNQNSIELIKKFKNKNLDLNIWVVNEIEKLEKYIKWGADYITTDWILPFGKE